MLEHLRAWIEDGELPTNLYRLLSAQLLDPNILELLSAARQANRFLLDFQNHSEADVVQRARNLQMLVAAAVDTFSDESKAARYEEEMVDRLWIQYSGQTDSDATEWRVLNVQRWLEVTKNVHPGRVASVANEMISRRQVESIGELGRQPNPPPSFRSSAFPTRQSPTYRNSAQRVRHSEKHQSTDDGSASPRSPKRRGSRRSHRPPTPPNNQSGSHADSRRSPQNASRNTGRVPSSDGLMCILAGAVITAIVIIAIAAAILVPRILQGHRSFSLPALQNATVER